MKNTIRKTTFCILFLIVGYFLNGVAFGQSTMNGNFTITAPRSSVFRVEGASNLSGQIKILSTQSGNIKVAYEKRAKASSRAEEKRFLNLIELRLTPVENDRTELLILSPSHAPWEGTEHAITLDVLVELPEKMIIEGRGSFINYEISGPFEGVDLDCEFSRADIRRIYGSVEIRTTEKDITLDAIRGMIEAWTNHGNIEASNIIVTSGYAVFSTNQGHIELEDIQGSVEAYTSHAEINAKNIDASDGSIVLRTNYSSVNVENISGELICETNHSQIVIKDFVLNHGHSEIQTSYSPIDIHIKEITNSDIQITNKYENVTLTMPEHSSTRIYASIDNSGQIRASKLNLMPIVLQPNRFEGILNDGGSRIEVKVTGIGEILFEGYK